MDEQVLVIPASLFEACAWQGFVPFDADVHTPLMLPENQQFRPRAEVELDPKWKQLIPYVVITRFGRVALYRRGKGQGEARLHSKCSIGFGGHINPCDTVGSLIGTLRLPGLPRNVPYRVGLSRELSEELQSASWNTACRTLGLIYDGTTDVGRVHLGVAHHLDISGLGDIAAA
jgi:predicted NUDIX family phosphoesterase